MTSRKQSSTRNQNGRIGKNGFSWAQKRQIRKKRRSSGQGLLERILEQFNYTHDSDLSNEDRVSIRDHPLGSQVPHRAQKLLLLPDDETETLGIISNAKRVSVDDNEIYSSSDRRIHRFARRYSGDH
ncbi:hypothetical protein WN55_00842 [Dufourea novaeangliae]|uniref:Uncharacterized protein n=2 Tax=Dufourea novaeangliae TaxID=178035 RepID=A0A154PD38_DUFNO|nr:hypothetical protein WN55_00842 [Dufourea novaeangliae]